jgi:hypothetical protein
VREVRAFLNAHDRPRIVLLVAFDDRTAAAYRRELGG